MALEERIKEQLERYYLTLGPIDEGTAASWFVPVPAGGALVAAHVSVTADPTADCTFTFEIAGVSVTTAGSATSLVVANGTAAGEIASVVIDGANVLKTAEDGDLLAAGATLEVITDGGGGVSIAVIVLEIQP